MVNRNQIADSIIDIDFINNVLIKKIYPDKVEIKIKKNIKIIGIILKDKKNIF